MNYSSTYKEFVIYKSSFNHNGRGYLDTMKYFNYMLQVAVVALMWAIDLLN